MKGTVQFDPKANAHGFYSIKVDGIYYSTGKDAPGVSKGDNVEFEAYQNEKGYWNVKKGTLKKVEGAQTPVASTPAAKPTGSKSYDRIFPVPTRHGDRSIIRQNSLAHATTLVLKTGSDLGKDLNGTANEVIRVAKIFEGYAAGDDERRQDEAKAAQNVAAQMTSGE